LSKSIIRFEHELYSKTISHAEGTHTGTETLYARGVSLEDFLSSDIELLLE